MTARHERLAGLADILAGTAAELRRRADLAAAVLRDPAVAASAELSPVTWEQVQDEVRRATTGRAGVRAVALDLEADAVAVRAAALTDDAVDRLRDLASRTLGSVAARASGYLAPTVELGGAVVSAGLIETDALDREGSARYLNDLAEDHPQLMDHVASGGGGLLAGLQLRSLLTAGATAARALAADAGRLAARGGLRATGQALFEVTLAGAVRDVAVEPGEEAPAVPAPRAPARGVPFDERPAGLAGLVESLESGECGVSVRTVGGGRHLVGLPRRPEGPPSRHLRLVCGDPTAYVAQATRVLEELARREGDVRVLLAGAGRGGVAAAALAAAPPRGITVEQLVTVGAPPALVPALPVDVPVLSLEDRADPVVLLASLVGASEAQRLSIVFDQDPEGQWYVDGAAAADRCEHPAVREALRRLRDLGYLRA